MGFFARRKSSPDIESELPKLGVSRAESMSEFEARIEPTSDSIIRPTCQSTFKPVIEPTMTRADLGALNAGSALEVAERHAGLLLERLVRECGGRRIFSDSARHDYENMCREIGISKRPWNMVGMFLRQLTQRSGQSEKPYISWIDELGKKRQVPVYAIPVTITRPLPPCHGPRRQRRLISGPKLAVLSERQQSSGRSNNSVKK
jgi:hypothetical protein